MATEQTETLKRAKVLVTGAAGFIGSHLVRRLHNEGAELCLLTRATSDTSNIDDILGQSHTISGDLKDIDAFAEGVQAFRPQYVFHLAAYTHVGREIEHADVALQENLFSTINLLNTIADLDVRRVVTVGTCEEYGDGVQPLTEKSPLRPASPYSLSKAAAMLWAQMTHRNTGLPIVVLRPFLCYGPGQEPSRLIPQAIFAALQDRDFPMTLGEQTREFTYVEDMVDAFVRAILTPEATGEVFNLGTADEHRVCDAVSIIFEIAGSAGKPILGAIPYRTAEMWRCVCSNEKARRILGWRPTVSLREGLTGTIAWYRDNLTKA